MMNHYKVKEIIKFSFFKNLQNKWFILFNVLTLISMIVILNWSTISNLFKAKEDDKVFEIVLIDSENLVYDSLLNRFSGDKAYNLTRATENTYTAENIPDNLMVLEIVPDEEKIFKTSVISKEGINTSIYNPVKDTLLVARNKLFAEKYNVTDEELNAFQSDLDITRIMLSVNAENSTTKEFIKLFSSALTYILTIFIFSKMANEISSEKESKSTEYILTTVSEKEYLFAKIFSNIAILIIQGLFLLVYYYIAVSIFSITRFADTDIGLTSISFTNILSKDIIYYVLALITYSVLNLILLCIIQATISSKTASTAEAGNTVSLLIFILLIAYITTVFVITPYTKVNIFIYILSCLPILSAYFVPAMMVIGQATIWQVVISLLILIASIPISFNLCAKIFKNGILDYTKVKKKQKPKQNLEEIQKTSLLKRQVKEIGFVIGISIIIYIGTQTIFSLFGGIILGSLFKDILTDTDISLILQIILQIISLGLASIFVFAYVDKNNEKTKEISLKNKIKIFFVAILFIFALQMFLSNVLYPFIGADYDTTELFDVSASSGLFTKVILILALSITPAIFEELFFRKAIISYTKQYGKVFSLIFSALLFGMMHLNISQGIFAFIIGLIFGAIYLYTGDIKLTMIIHFVNNGFAALTMILPETGVAILTIWSILILTLAIGVCILLVTLSKNENREKIKELINIKVSLSVINTKYKYIFTDYAFDISLILVVLMSVLTENMLR